MIECQWWQLIYFKPCKIFCIIGGRGQLRIIGYAPISNSDGMSARVASWLSKRTELLQSDICETRLFSQFPQCSIINILIFINKPSW